MLWLKHSWAHWELIVVGQHYFLQCYLFCNECQIDIRWLISGLSCIDSRGITAMVGLGPKSQRTSV